MANGIGSFDVEHSHVVDLSASPARTGFAGGFLDATGEPFDPKKIFFGLPLSEGKEKGAIAASQIDMHWGVAAEDFAQIEARDVRFRDQFDHGDKLRLRRDDSTSTADALSEETRRWPRFRWKRRNPGRGRRRRWQRAARCRPDYLRAFPGSLFHRDKIQGSPPAGK